MRLGAKRVQATNCPLRNWTLSPFCAVYRAIAPAYRGLIRTTIEEQLRFEPETETRNRKPLQPPVAFEATWELRFGPDNRFRVFYWVSHAPREAQILAVGRKEGSRLMIGREEIKL